LQKIETTSNLEKKETPITNPGTFKTNHNKETMTTTKIMFLKKRRTRNRNRNRRNNKGQNQNFSGNFQGFSGNFPPNFPAGNFNPPFGGRTYGSVVSGFPANNFNNFNQGFPQTFNQNPQGFSQQNPRGTRRPRGGNQGQNINNTNQNVNNNNFEDSFGNGPRGQRRNRTQRNQPQGQNQPRARPEPREKIPSTTTLYVTNLPFSCTDDGLLQIFKDCKPKSAHIVFTRNGRSRGYGFVEFEDETAQKKALELKHNTDVPDSQGTRTIQVSVSHSTGKLADNDGQETQQ